MIHVITFGTFDVFHLGHLRLLERARTFGDYLVVGVSTDALTHTKKGRHPIQPQEERKAIVGALRCVDQVFNEESLDRKGEYIHRYKADVLVMGDDWLGQFDNFRSLCKIEYLPRTPSISTTELIEKIQTEH